MNCTHAYNQNVNVVFERYAIIITPRVKFLFRHWSMYLILCGIGHYFQPPVVFSIRRLLILSQMRETNETEDLHVIAAITGIVKSISHIDCLIKP